MTWAKMAKIYYDEGLWSKEYIATLVPDYVAKDEYKDITGEDYVAPTNTAKN